MPETTTPPNLVQASSLSQRVQDPENSTFPISVIIPTYNRRKWLGEILDSIALQTLPFDQFEVIIVDDGSSDSTGDIVQQVYPFKLRYFYQKNQGDAAARNLGAKQSEAEFLVFLDDDIILEKDFLANVLFDQPKMANCLIVGTDILWVADTNPLTVFAPIPTHQQGDSRLEKIPFADVCSNNMAIRREAYFSIGMMEWLDFPGSSMWCDVDFAYRAFQKGFEFVRNRRAFCWHRDYVLKNLQNQRKRMREVAYRAVVLFQKYPELVHYIPMFSDKTPIDWKQDDLGLIVRKWFRFGVSSSPVLWFLEKILSLGANRLQFAGLNSALERWMIGGYIYRGYRDGLRKFGPIRSTAKP